jgi:hypothetical protein
MPLHLMHPLLLAGGALAGYAFYKGAGAAANAAFTPPAAAPSAGPASVSGLPPYHVGYQDMALHDAERYGGQEVGRGVVGRGVVGTPFQHHVSGMVVDEWGNVYDDGDSDADLDPSSSYDPTMDPNNYDAFGNYVGPDVGDDGTYGMVDSIGSVSSYGSSATYGTGAYGGVPGYATPLQDPANYDANGNYVPVDPTENVANYDGNGNYIPPPPMEDPLNYNAQGDYIGPPDDSANSVPLTDYDGSPLPSAMIETMAPPVFDPFSSPLSPVQDGAFGPMPTYPPGGPPAGVLGPEHFAYAGAGASPYGDNAMLGSIVSYPSPSMPTYVEPTGPADISVDMQFRAHQWIVVTKDSTDLRHALPPPPHQSANAGAWHRYPGGIGHGPWGKSFGHTQVNPGGARPMVTVRVWNVPEDTTVYAWRPNTGTMAMINGLWYYGTGDWYVGSSPSGEHIYTLSKADLPPPPPGATGITKINGVVYDDQNARWVLDHPGLLTWRSEAGNRAANTGRSGEPLASTPLGPSGNLPAASPATTGAPTGVPTTPTGPHTISPQALATMQRLRQHGITEPDLDANGNYIGPPTGG